MKSLHRPDMYAWSVFDRDRNMDFNSCVWIRPEGNILIDPLALSDYNFDRLNSFGGAAWIVITNSDHMRAAKSIAHVTGAKIAAPLGEKETFPIAGDAWLMDGDELVPGLQVFALSGSKTPGELALLIEGKTLVTGDLIRAPKAGSLTMLPDEKLSHKADAVASVRRIAAIDTIETVLVGDGWSVFRNGSDLLKELAATL
jgi:glyoxylase-like metal-dependent hydrolase (beta-lactamase superfamily II)